MLSHVRTLVAFFLLFGGQSATAAVDPCNGLSALKAKPPVWIASDADTKIVLIATVHLLPARTQWRSDLLDTAIKSADELIVDTRVSSKEDVTVALSRRAFAMNLPPIRDRVQPQLWPALMAASERFKMAPGVLDKMKTWAVSFLVNGTSKSSCQSGISSQLENEFGRTNRKVTPLQTADSSLADFDTLPETAQGELLAQALEASQDQQFQSMVHLWAAGDLDGTAAVAQKELGKSPALLSMLSRINARLGAGLVRLMDKPGTKIAVLGVLQFTGRDSVLEMLRKGGYKVRRLQ